jgi:putative spermidine/putrescine transport system substrate-binding protein
LFLLQANALNGGTYDNVDPGFAAVKRLAPNVKGYYRSIGEVRPILNNESAIVAVSTNILQGEVDQGRPVGIVFPREGCLASPMVAQVIRGTKVKALAEEFIDYYIRPDAQRGWATQYYVSVFNRNAAVPESVNARITRGNLFFDAEQVSAHREAWVDRWTREIRG